MARAALHRFTLPAPKFRVRRQIQPDSIRLHYFSSIRAFISKAHALVTRDLLPLVHDLAHADATDEERIKAAVEGIAREFARNMPPRRLRELAAQVFERTSDLQRAQLYAQIKDAISMDVLITDPGLEAKAAAFVAENVDLIKTVPVRYFAEISDTVLDGVRSSRRASDIARDLEERYNVSESNAARIANDQVGKAFGDLNRERQTDLGITRFTWATSQDNRVRDEHRVLEGKEFEWDDPPEVDGEKIIPGEAVNCRCDALPVIEDLIG